MDPGSWELVYGTPDAPATPAPEGWAAKELATALVGRWEFGSLTARHAGRRLRTFASMVSCYPLDGKWTYHWRDGVPSLQVMPLSDKHMTYPELYEWVRDNPEYHDKFSQFQLRLGGPETKQKWDHIPAEGEYTWMKTSSQQDPMLHHSLQDLAQMLVYDLIEAAGVLNNPDVYYPGVDEGIEPVSDDHVNLVIWAMARELNRELRAQPGRSIVLPPLPIQEFPWRIKRALAERRRLRYREWGIGREQWEKGEWSIFEIEEGADWIPPWYQPTTTT